jgi:hypothetical protein
MHTNEFGQAYCIYLLNRILGKFILYFFEFYTIYYEFWNFKQISRNLKIEKQMWKRLNDE